jgi:excisionase family DNA binding protein
MLASVATPAAPYRLPALDGLFEQFKTTFAQHVEVEDSAQGRVLRVAGQELWVREPAGSGQALQATVCERLAEVAAYGLATALSDASEQGRSQRMEMISALAMLEVTAGAAQAPAGHRKGEHAGGDLLTTAEVAAQLGMSRPYVSMLCDQGKLGEVTRSEGGHRRITKLAVEAYVRQHGTPARPRTTP